MGDSAPDKRLAWLGSRVCSTLKVKDDVWKGIVSGESKYAFLSCMQLSTAATQCTRRRKTPPTLHTMTPGSLDIL